LGLAGLAHGCYNAAVSDWRQIQARIRKARTSADPSGQLAALFERTRDAMVAFELARIHEKSGEHAEAARWYTAAAERFRRAQWKQKAEEALARLGAQPPSAPAAAVETPTEPVARFEPIIAEFTEEHVSETAGEADGGEQESVFGQPVVGAAAPQPQAAKTGPGPQRRRRGRRGGRGRHKGVPAGAQSTPARAPLPAPSEFERAGEPRRAGFAPPRSTEDVVEHHARGPEPGRSFEPAPVGSALPARAGRSGDPALSSRMAQLESQLRRMLACAPQSLEEADEAPAGPGVFLVTDNDQTSYYYIESCQTLRVGIGNMARGGRGSRESAVMKEKLADHLGITESRVTKYLKDHCMVRWLQLDEGAPLLAHFAIAVLRPIANE
jgi:hypothetical protein